MNPAGRRSWLAVTSTLLLAAIVLLHPFPSAAESKAGKAVAPRLASRNPGGRHEAAARTQRIEPCLHRVRQGESATRIAERYGVSSRRLMQANHLPEQTVLRVGRTLVVPGCGARAPLAEQAPGSLPPGEVMLARVGPLRVPTRVYLGIPERDAMLVDFVWPVEGPVASGFGRRRSGWHAGLDIKADRGTPILAAGSGVVSFSGWEPAYGRVIKIEHPHGFRTIYAHNLQNHVQPGEWVEAGTPVGLVGNSGRTTGTHLHFELRQADIVHNPLHFLSPRDTPLVAAVAAADQPASGGGP